MTSPPDSIARTHGWYHPRRASGRVVAAAVVGLVVWFVSGRFTPSVRAIAAWNAASVTLIGMTWRMITRADARETARRAGAEDPGRTLVWVLVLLSCGIGLFAATGVLRQARLLDPEGRDMVVCLCLMAVASAWTLTHSAFTLRYARLFYRDDDEGVGGLVFPGDHPPADFDFAYFAFTVGMCFQVSDVTITSPLIRRTVLMHAVISFVYNTTILALALNLVFGLFN